MKNNKGITLIALVITIIILLILASVSIAILMGENGILKNAEIAKVETEKANVKEKLQIEIINKMQEIMIQEQRKMTNKDLENIEGISNLKVKEDGRAEFKYEDYFIKIDDKLNIISIEKQETIVELEDTPLVPDMTSDTTPKGTVTVSAQNLIDPAQYAGWKAFSQVEGYIWSTWPTEGENQWLTYEFVNPVQLSKIDMKSRGGLKDFSILGSNNGIDFEIIFQGTQEKNKEVQTYELSEYSKSYLSIKFLANTLYTEGSNLVIEQIQYYGRETPAK